MTETTITTMLRDPERLLDAHDVARCLGYPNHRSVYALDIPQTRTSPRRVRWKARDVKAFMDGGRQPAPARMRLVPNTGRGRVAPSRPEPLEPWEKPAS